MKPKNSSASVLSMMLLLTSCGEAADQASYPEDGSKYVLAWTEMAPFPEGFFLKAFEHDDENLGGEGCRRDISSGEANSINAAVQIGEPVQMQSRTITDADIFAVKGPDGQFASLITPTISRNFDGQYFRLSEEQRLIVMGEVYRVLRGHGCIDVEFYQQSMALSYDRLRQ